MIELTAKGTEELDALCKEYEKRTGKEVSESEMTDMMVQMGHYNLIGMWK